MIVFLQVSLGIFLLLLSAIIFIGVVAIVLCAVDEIKEPKKSISDNERKDYGRILDNDMYNPYDF